MIRLLYNHRTIGFYHKKYLLLSTAKEPDVVFFFRRYVELLNAIGTREPQTIRTALDSFLDHVEQTMFTDLPRLQFAAVKILDELYLKLTDMDMEVLARMSQSFSSLRRHHCLSPASVERSRCTFHTLSHLCKVSFFPDEEGRYVH